jgi:hypothetical protein
MIHVLLTDMACVIRFKLTYKQTIKDITVLYITYVLQIIPYFSCS